MTQQCPQGPLNSDSIEDLYPQGSRPEIRLDTLSALCSYGVTPLVMTGALRHVLIQHFSDPRNILNSTLRGRIERDGVWTEGQNTGLLIESLQMWRPELTEARPGLVLNSGQWNWKRIGIGDQAGEDYRSGRRFFGGYWQGSHTVFALAKEGAEAQILAIEVMKALLWYEAEIAQQLELQRFIPVSIGEIAALKEAREHYVIPLVVAYEVPEFWYIQPDAPRTKRIVFRASETLASY